MPKAKTDFTPVFTELKAIMAKQASGLTVTDDSASTFALYTPPTEATNGKPGWFGMVQIKKTYVAYHLMPVYVFPDLLEGISPELKKRMQGKSCFNFSASDKALFKELGALTKNGLARYKKEKLA